MNSYRPVRSYDDLRRLSQKEQEARARALEAIAEVRRSGGSLSAATRAADTTVAAVRRYARPAVERLPNGRYRVKPSDRLYRRIRVISVDGPVWVDTWSSKNAQLASDHANAIRGFGLGRGGDALASFGGRSVGDVELETDVLALGAMAAAGDLDEFDLYDDTST